ncbi:retrovirus-related pol polyprotein from transposon TNT 1-94 [Tanacetum coccineum]
MFGSKCFILNTKDYLTKFDPKSYDGVFLGYSQNSKVYIILNKHTMKIKESLNVTFDESPPPTNLSPLSDDDVCEERAVENQVELDNNIENETLEDDAVINIKESKNQPLDKIQIQMCESDSNPEPLDKQTTPKNVNEALKYESWVVAMQEELNQFVSNEV